MDRLIAIAILCAASHAARADDLDAQLATVATLAPACSAKHCIGVHLHVAATDSTLVASPDWLAAQIATADKHLATIDVGLTVVATDRASAMRVDTPADRDAIVGTTGLHAGAIDVYVTFRLADVDATDDTYIRGVTWRRHSDPDHKYIILSIAAGPRTLAHELGHFFGLPHSKYAISIMNKTPRDQPPQDQRRYADEEIPILKKTRDQLLADKVIVDVP
jgi:hypothetical protein|nr:hypothetical protein [Kofleriaceae bacterium]